MTISRRKFVKSSLVAAGTVAATLGGLRLFPNLFAAKAEAARRENSPQNNAQNSNAQGAWQPAYVALEESGELARREQALTSKLSRCDLCPRLCNVNRAGGAVGICGTADTFKVASFAPHHGEEAPLRGRNGSGTIFISDCSLLCVFCINWQIAHRGDGTRTSHERLANMMIDLQRRGCHNINFVSPTHVLPHIIKALRIAIGRGLRLPLVYNSSGYEMVEVIQMLDGIFDIYLPDFKYQSGEVAARFSRGATDYPERAAAAIKEMHRQVGVLQTANGIAQRGLLIRHLVMPENLAGTDGFVRWVANELGTDTHVNIMSQYTPMFQANQHPPLDRRITREEFDVAMNWARDAGLKNFH